MILKHQTTHNCIEYRFGFNGMEADDEVYGVTGSSYTAKFWQYDSRLGRRWNVDPIDKPWESSYAAFANNPIYFVDPFGLTATNPPSKGDFNPETGQVYNGESWENHSLPEVIVAEKKETIWQKTGGFFARLHSWLQSHEHSLDLVGTAQDPLHGRGANFNIDGSYFQTDDKSRRAAYGPAINSKITEDSNEPLIVNADIMPGLLCSGSKGSSLRKKGHDIDLDDLFDLDGSEAFNAFAKTFEYVTDKASKAFNEPVIVNLTDDEVKALVKSNASKTPKVVKPSVRFTIVGENIDSVPNLRTNKGYETAFPGDTVYHYKWMKKIGRK